MTTTPSPGDQYLPPDAAQRIPWAQKALRGQLGKVSFQMLIHGCQRLMRLRGHLGIHTSGYRILYAPLSVSHGVLALSCAGHIGARQRSMLLAQRTPQRLSRVLRHELSQDVALR